MAASISVRPLTSSTEREIYFQLADQAFSSDPSPTNVQYWQQLVTALPEYQPEHVRGAFRDGELSGGYTLFERTLQVGAARLLTGCLGAVVTHPTHRHQGVATALMRDAIDYAFSHQYALLLLDGIPNFYSRYGYIDVFDLSVHDIDRTAILALPRAMHTVRPATIADAVDILALYEHHYGPYTGSFTRTIAQQAHRLQYRSPDNPLLLAVDPTSHIQGYLALQGDDRTQAQEFVADTWQAALALLQYHAQLLEGTQAPAALRYRMSPTTPALQWMIDHLEVPDASRWKSPHEAWSVRSETYHHRNAAWMARPVHLPTLMQAMLPEWQARWRRSLAHWSGNISLIIGEERCVLHISGTEIQLVDQAATTVATATESIRLTPQAFTQLVFGYRTVNSAMPQGAQSVGGELLSALNVLFPTGHTWIPSSDWF